MSVNLLLVENGMKFLPPWLLKLNKIMSVQRQLEQPLDKCSFLCVSSPRNMSTNSLTGLHLLLLGPEYPHIN